MDLAGPFADLRRDSSARRANPGHWPPSPVEVLALGNGPMFRQKVAQVALFVSLKSLALLQS